MNSGKRKAELIKQISAMKAEISLTQQKANRLKAENMRIEIHTGMMEIINVFMKNSLNYRAVDRNLFLKKIKIQVGDQASDVTNEIIVNELAQLAEKDGNGDTDTGQEAESFAVDAVERELHARGIPFDNIYKDPDLALLVVYRLIEYKKARLRWHILFLKKECHGVEHQDSEMRDAAFAGFLLRVGEIDNPEVKKWLAKVTTFENLLLHQPSNFSKTQKARMENLARCFRRACAGQQKATWKNPAIDSWLLLVWPLVEAEKWNYATVHYLAELKFPDFDGPVLRNSSNLAAHCKLVLGLKIKTKSTDKPKKNQRPSPLHMFAVRIGDSFPDFSSFGNG